MFGMYDIGLTPGVRRWGERDLALSTPIIEWFADNFLPGLPVERREHPDVSPLHADLAGLPPALFTVGALDPLLDDSLFMAARWDAGGNDTEVVVVPEAIHGFTAFPGDLTLLAMGRQLAFLRACVASAPG